VTAARIGERTQGSGTTPTLWDRRRQLASQEILQAAFRLFTQQGYDETTIAQVARETGVSQRALFRYVGARRTPSAAARSGSSLS
jgi:AcrR family transcriptional regulator